MEKQLIFLVKPDLVLHEKTFEKLREFVERLDLSKLDMENYHTLDYSAENDEILYYSIDFALYARSQDLIDNHIIVGYMLINFEDLKKFLSL